MIIKFTIPGNPFGKQRPLVVGYRKKHGIKREKTRLYENKAREAWHNAYDGPEQTWDVSMNIKAFYEIPKSWPKWKKKAALQKLLRPNKKSPLKCDADNAAKMVMDSVNPETYHHKIIRQGIYHDDGQVVDLHIESWYSDNPRVEVTINAQPEPDLEIIKQMMKSGK